VEVSGFLATVAAAERLLATPDLVEMWERPSALEGYRVSGLAGHLARAVLTLDGYLDVSPPTVGRDTVTTDAAGYIVAVLGGHDPVESGFHRAVRERAQTEAADGPLHLLERWRAAHGRLADRLPTADGERLVEVLDGVVLPLEAYVATRAVELVVHLDDLAVSLGRPEPPELPVAVVEQVAATLAVVAARRVGGLATVRSLARRERQREVVRAL
jgi:uncharacterized protein (TIGR03083 family)